MQACWQLQDGALHYQGPCYALTAQPQRGWTGLSVHGHAFLDPPPGLAAMVYRRADRLIGRFHDAGPTLSETHILREAAVSDGVYLQRMDCISPTRIELYAGFNDAAAHDLLLLLAPDVRLVRLGSPAQYRAARSVWHPPASPAPPETAESAILVHRSGAWLEIAGPLRCEILALPHRAPQPCLVLPCRGFAANRFSLEAGPLPDTALTLAAPAFCVHGDQPLPAGETAPIPGVRLPVFGPAEPMQLGLACTCVGPEGFTGSAELELIHMDGTRLAHQSVPLHIPPGERFRFPGDRLAPARTGPMEAFGRLLARDGTLLWAHRFRLLYDPEAYAPEVTRQPDHDTFWKQTLAEMRARPLDLKVEHHFQEQDWDCMEVSYNVLAPRRIHAMLMLPRAARPPVPVIITAHPNTQGWGRKPDAVHGSRIDRDPRFAWFVPLIRGHRPDAEDIPFNHPWWGPMENRDTYEGRYWFSAMPRCLDVLAALDVPVDVQRAVALGGSQGGALALVTAGLDPRICLCLADCPSHCQIQNTLRGYPLMRSRLAQLPAGMTPEQAERLLSYFDAANACPSIRCPVMIAHHVGDMTVHIAGGLAAYKNLTRVPPDRKWFIPGPGIAHANPAEGTRRKEALLQAVLAGTIRRGTGIATFGKQ